ncbi:hypothetical protein J1605_015139 [Eschrichtius robustus]|uniref:Uncharacterized protein n=1 Tax=Eschrichtius robustus TaxID=9764 RepID=A0AB34GAM3_ESCRO|nr:hypothetical protein J1605_015139 [Eschrichtius robustus]
MGAGEEAFTHDPPHTRPRPPRPHPSWPPRPLRPSQHGGAEGRPRAAVPRATPWRGWGTEMRSETEACLGGHEDDGPWSERGCVRHIRFLPQPGCAGPRAAKSTPRLRPCVPLLLQPPPHTAPKGPPPPAPGLSPNVCSGFSFPEAVGLDRAAWPDAGRDSGQPSGDTCSSSYVWGSLSSPLSDGKGGAVGVS